VNYYERHLGDYARDTAHLTLLEHGVYNVLLDRYYITEQPIPADQAHRIARARTKEERAAVDAVLSEFFTLDGGNYRQGRVDAEIAAAQVRINAARENGRTGGRPKRNPRPTPIETQQKPAGLSTGSENITQQKALQSPVSKHQSPVLPPVALSEGAWEGHREWALDELRSVYPSNLHTDADWEMAARTIAGRLTAGETTRDTLHGLVCAFAAQQDAKNSRNTQYIENPVRHFDGRGRWKGPFAVPAAVGSAVKETAMDRIYAATSGNNDRDDYEALEHHAH
jgi:uncharacterized protein YdaU (DUF1376 family)